MAEKKISQLDERRSIDYNDFTIIDNSTSPASNKLRIQTLADFFVKHIDNVRLKFFNNYTFKNSSNIIVSLNKQDDGLIEVEAKVSPKSIGKDELEDNIISTIVSLEQSATVAAANAINASNISESNKNVSQISAVSANNAATQASENLAEVIDMHNLTQEAKALSITSASNAKVSAENAKVSEENALDSATKAISATVNTPYIGDNDNWFVWDFTQNKYIDTGKSSNSEIFQYQLKSNLPLIGDAKYLYVVYADIHQNNGMYRWNGTEYETISNPVEFASQDEALEGVNNTKAMSPLRVKEVVDTVTPPPMTKAEYEALVASGLDIEDVIYTITDSDVDYDSIALDLQEHVDDISIHTPTLTANMKIYVSPIGSDETGDGSESKPYATPKKATNVTNSYFSNGYDITVYYDEGIYENCGLININTDNKIFWTQKLNATTKPQFNDIQIVNYKGLFIAHNLSFNANINNNIINLYENADITLYRCTLKNIHSTGGALSFNKNATITECEIYSRNGIISSVNGVGTARDLTGECGYPYYCYGGILKSFGTAPKAKIQLYVIQLGGIYIKDGVIQGQSESGTWTPKLQTKVNGVMTDIAFTIIRAKWSKIENRYFINLALTINDLNNIKHGLYITNLPAICNVSTSSAKTEITFLKEDYRYMAIKSAIRANEQYIFIFATDNTNAGMELYDAYINVQAPVHNLILDIEYEAV